MNETHARPQFCSNFFPRKANEPERHSFLLLLEINFKPNRFKSFCTSKNSDFKIPARTKIPPGFNCATIFFRSAISRLEIKFAQTKSNCSLRFCRKFCHVAAKILIFLKRRLHGRSHARRGPLQDQNQSREPACNRVSPPQSPKFQNPCRCPKMILRCSGRFRRRPATISLQAKFRRRMLASAETQSGIENDDGLIFRGRFLLQLGLTSSELPIL
jgi:hypothetical protein